MTLTRVFKMAASMHHAARLFRQVIFKKFSLHEFTAPTLCGYATSSELAEYREVEYPPIKPKYPPGDWGDIAPKICWNLHDRGLELNDIPKVNLKLD